jgi:hypothetical protein
VYILSSATFLAAGCSGHSSGAIAPAAAPASPAAPVAAAPAPAPAPTIEIPAGGPPPGCATCKSLFDGKTLDGWSMEKPESFEVKEGAIASTGKGSHLWTKDDFTDYRLLFSVRHTKIPAKDHRPTVTFFNTRPVEGEKFVRGLAGVQLQPPHGGSWDYRKRGQDGDPKKNPQFYERPANRPTFDDTKWHRCAVLVKGSVGEFRAACCEIEGRASCQAVEVLHFKDPSLAGNKGPFSIQIHNDGLLDEYKDLWVDTGPTGDALISAHP